MSKDAKVKRVLVTKMYSEYDEMVDVKNVYLLPDGFTDEQIMGFVGEDKYEVLNLVELEIRTLPALVVKLD